MMRELEAPTFAMAGTSHPTKRQQAELDWFGERFVLEEGTREGRWRAGERLAAAETANTMMWPVPGHADSGKYAFPMYLAVPVDGIVPLLPRPRVAKALVLAAQRDGTYPADELLALRWPVLFWNCLWHGGGPRLFALLPGEPRRLAVAMR